MYALSFYFCTRIGNTGQYYKRLEIENTNLKTQLATREEELRYATFWRSIAKNHSGIEVEYEELIGFVGQTLRSSHTISTNFYKKRFYEDNLHDYNKMLDKILKANELARVHQTVYEEGCTVKVSTVYDDIHKVNQQDLDMERKGVWPRKFTGDEPIYKGHYRTIHEKDPILRTAYINRFKAHIAKRAKSPVFSFGWGAHIWVVPY